MKSKTQGNNESGSRRVPPYALYCREGLRQKKADIGRQAGERTGERRRFFWKGVRAIDSDD
jgi:hypothetical protein